MSSLARLESIYRDLEKEHLRVMKLLARLREKASVADVLTMLDELRTLLIVHFAREQLPDGFYDALGELADSRRHELQVLIAEHASILSSLNALLDEARDAAEVDESGLMIRVSDLLVDLDRHEHKEHRFATDVLESTGRTH